MKSFRAVFLIVEDNNCPLYELEDNLVLSERSLAFPEGKESCLILVRELTQLLFELMDTSGPNDYQKNIPAAAVPG